MNDDADDYDCYDDHMNNENYDHESESQPSNSAAEICLQNPCTSF